MRLILQCAVCGTVNAVGLTECGTCRATGFENLRLLFECLHCFQVGLTPSCEKCSKLLPLDPAYEVIPDPVDAHELARRWGVAGDEPESADGELLKKAPDPKWDEELPVVGDSPTLDEKAGKETEPTFESGDPRRGPPA